MAPGQAGTDVESADAVLAVSEALRIHEIDVVGFQEVPFDAVGESHLIDELMHGTELDHVARLPLSPSSFFPDGRTGLALASRYPFKDVQALILPNPHLLGNSDGMRIESHDKGLIRASIDLLGQTIHVVTVHMLPFHRFGRGAEDGAFEESWRALGQAVDAFDSAPSVITGDFNTHRRELLTAITESPLQSGLRGAPTHRGKAVDDILFSKHFTMRESRVLPTFSDHDLCWLELATDWN